MGKGGLKKVIMLVFAVAMLCGIVPGMEFFEGSVYAANSGWTIIDGNQDNGLNTDSDRRAVDIQSAILNNEVYVSWLEESSSYSDCYIRVKKFDGTTWSLIDGGSGRNRTTSKDMVIGSSIVAYNNAIYLAWTETKPGLGWQIYVDKYENGVWTSVDAGTINRSSSSCAATYPNLVVYNNNLYITWSERNASYIDQLHVKRYDGGTTWSFVDGNTDDGLNYNTTNAVTIKNAKAFGSDLYLAFLEWTGTEQQLRVKKYNGTTWSAADGGISLNVNSFNNSSQISMEVFGTNLYMTWLENGSDIYTKKYDGTTWTMVDEASKPILHPTSSASAPKLYSDGSNLYHMFILDGKVRVRKYDGTIWTYIDANTGINKNITSNAEYPTMAISSTEVYALWNENNSSYIQQLRAAKYIPLTITPSSTLNEQNLDTASITLSIVAGTTFKDNTLDKTNFTILNGPMGLTVESVSYIDDKHCKIDLAFEGTNFDANITNLGIQVDASELLAGFTLVSSNDLAITAYTKPAAILNSLQEGSLNTAVDVNAEVTADGGLTVTERGIEWKLSTDSNYTTVKDSGNGVGSFSKTLSGLSLFNTYNFRAYAVNDEGTSYSSVMSFAPGVKTFSISPPIQDVSLYGVTLNGTDNYAGIGYYTGAIEKYAMKFDLSSVQSTWSILNVKLMFYIVPTYSTGSPVLNLVGCIDDSWNETDALGLPTVTGGTALVAEQSITQEGWLTIEGQEIKTFVVDQIADNAASFLLSGSSTVPTGDNDIYIWTKEYTDDVTLRPVLVIEYKEPTLDSIEITEAATKTAYQVGDELDLTGLVVTGTYSDNNTKPETITTSNVTGFDSSAVAASQTLTITVDGKIATYSISVAKADGPALSGVTSSDLLNTVTGMTDAMDFSTNGTTWTVYNAVTPNLPSLTETVDLQVRVAETATHTAGAASTFNFTIPTLNNIAITTPANETAYKVGDTLDLTGLVVTGNYSDTSTKTETITASNVTGFDSSAVAASQTLTVTVGGKTATYSIAVAKANGTALTGVTSSDILNTVTGMAATMDFSTDGTTWTAYDAGTPNLPNLTGTVELQVRVAATATHEAGAAITFNFTVPTLVSIEIIAAATKTEYKVGDMLDLTGLVVTGTYSDTSTKPETITTGNVTGFNSSAVATSQTLTVTVGGKTTTYSISVAKANGTALTGVTSSDIMNTVTGMAATMDFSTDGTNWTTYNAATPNLPDLTGTVALQVKVAATATHEAGAATTFNFTVPTLNSIGITAAAEKTAYKVGDELVLIGLEVTGNYSDTSTKTETITTSNVTGFDSSAVAASQTLTVTVGGKIATYNISVAKADGPALTGVTSSNILNTVTGMAATMDFSTDGTTWTAYDAVTPNLTDLTGTVDLQVRVAATATHEAGAATTFNFTVATLVSIEIIAADAKTAYKVGDELDLTGLVVTGTYSDSSTEPETITTSNVTGFDSLAVATSQTLTVTVGGKIATYNISVAKADGPALTGVTSSNALNTVTGMTDGMEFTTNGAIWIAYNAVTPNLPELTGTVDLQVRVAASATHEAGAATAFNFTITTLDSIEITTAATKIAYKVGDTLDMTGLVVTGTYDDTSTKLETITTGNITGFDSSSVSSIQILTVTVDGKIATYNISVVKADGPLLTGVTSSNALNTVTGMTGGMEFSTDGTTWTTYNAVTPNLPDLTRTVDLQVRVAATATYEAGVATTFNFTAATLDSIEITTAATKTAYKVGDTLDLTGLVVTGTYSDSSTKLETITTANVTGFDSLAVATSQTLTVTVGGKTVTYIISIAKANSPTTPTTTTPTTTTPATPATPVENGVEIFVNGKTETAATSTTTKVGDKTVITVTVNDKKVEEKLEKEGNNAVVTIPLKNVADVVVGQLNGQTVKNMENKEAVLEIKTENVTYTLPASQINIDSVSEQLGQQMELKDITVRVTIAEPSKDTVKIVEDTAKKNSYQLIVKPVEFEITCTSGNKTVDVSKFNSYVERTVAIPDGIDPSKITTGIVLNNDGTFSHIPTAIIIIDGKYYAKINSLTNSTYSVIWSPKAFKDVETHWAKEAINDMGSRLVIGGVGDNKFEPNRDITRAEFVTILVKALGLMKPNTGKVSFSDVAKEAWYYNAVSIAYEYDLISGYGNNKFGPMDTLTREQAMTIIANAMKITGLKVELSDSEVESLLSGFGDSEKSAQWAKESMVACVKEGIVSGKGGKTLAPKDEITRAEVAVIVRRLLQKSNLI